MPRSLRALSWSVGILILVPWIFWSLQEAGPAATSFNRARNGAVDASHRAERQRREGGVLVQNDAVMAPADALSDSVEGDHDDLELHLRRTAVFGEEGRLRGMRVYPGANEQVFEEAGLKAGDLLVAVDGEPLNDPVRASEILDGMGGRSPVRLTVERAGIWSDLTMSLPSGSGGFSRN